MTSNNPIKFNNENTVVDKQAILDHVANGPKDPVTGKLEIIRLANGVNDQSIIVEDPESQLLVINSQNAAGTYSRVVLVGLAINLVVKLHKEEGNTYLFVDGSWI